MAYGEERVGPPHWAPALEEELRNNLLRRSERRERADVYRLGPPRPPGRAVVGWIDAGVGDVEDTRAGRAQVRGRRECVEVLVVRRRRDGTLTTFPHLPGGRGGLEVPEMRPPDPDTAKVVAECLLTLPQCFSRGDALERTIGELRRMQIDAWQSWRCPWLRGELLLVMDEKGRVRLTDFDLEYSPADGLLVTPVNSPPHQASLPSRTPASRSGSRDTNTVPSDALL
jgi:CRISPR system Cascade subunit CasA